MAKHSVRFKPEPIVSLLRQIEVMSKPVMVISEDRNMLDLAEIFCGDGHHHIPVINETKQLVGMITQSDFVKAIDQSIDIR